MRNRDKYRWILGMAAGVSIVAATAGCGGDGQPNESYPTGDQSSAVQRLEQLQTNRGTRDDATLRAYHFDGTQLNTLGQARLDQMIADGDVATNLVVYLDLPGDAEQAQRQQAVNLYLKDRGLRDEQIRLESGANPKSTMAVSPTLPQPPAQGQQQGGAPAASGMSPTASTATPAPASH
jgi:hypothetical protein